MAYATLTEFKARLGSNVSPPGMYEMLTDRVDATTGDDAVGQAMVDEANAWVNQKLARRYRVPIDTTGEAELAAWLRSAVLTIATWQAWVRHPVRSTIKLVIQGQYDALVATLERIAAGAESLVSTAALPGPTSDGAAATAFGDDVVLTKDGLAGLM